MHTLQPTLASSCLLLRRMHQTLHTWRLQDAEVMLLDNVFAAVDGATAAQLVEALQGPLGAGRTRIVVSNHAPLLAAADVVVKLDLGRVRSVGALVAVMCRPPLAPETVLGMGMRRHYVIVSMHLCFAA